MIFLAHETWPLLVSPRAHVSTHSMMLFKSKILETPPGALGEQVWI